MMDLFMELLKDEDRGVRSAIAASMSKMAEQGEFAPDMIEVWLIRIVSGAS